MKSTMMLEVEEGASLEEMISVILVMEEEYKIEDERLIGCFDNSNSYFVFRQLASAEQIVAEGVGFDWAIGVRGAFHCPVSKLSEASIDLENFVTILSGVTDFRFVLSFQYETIYAIRDELGLNVLRRMVN